MHQDKTSRYSTEKSVVPKTPKPQSRSTRRREGTEGNNAIQSQPDDSKEVSMLDSGKHSERSPYTAGSQ